MPNCFQLTRIGESEPSSLLQVDALICEHFAVPCHNVRYHAGWYDVIGFRLALGKSFADIKRYLLEQAEGSVQYHSEYMHLVAICEWLEANYTPDSWHERKNG